MTRTLPALLLAFFVSHGAVVEAQGRRDTQGEAEMLERINALRVEAGASPLVRHAALDQAALIHSQEMAETGALVHASERTGDPADRVEATGVEANRIAQNIALRSSTEGALSSILDSEPHRAQLLATGLTHVGLASVRGRRGMYVTQLVAALEGPAALPAPSYRDLRGTPSPAAATASEGSDAATEPEPELAPTIETPLVRIVPSEPAEQSNAPAEPAAAAPCPLAEAPAAEPAAAVEAYEAEAQAYEPEAQAYQNEPSGYHEDPYAAAPSSADAPPYIRLPNGPRAGVSGYWVFHGGRWWFFPIPAGTVAGAVLQPDPHVTGAPAGYDAHGRQTQQPRVTPAPRRAPFGGWSPRRHGEYR